MDLRTRAARGIAWSAVQNWGTMLLNTVVFVVLARLLAPEAFGLLAVAAAFISFAEIFVSQGFNRAIVQREDLEPEHLHSVFWIIVTSGVVLTGIGVAASGPIAALYGQPGLKPIIRVLSAQFIIGAWASTHAAILQRDLAFHTLAVRRLVATAVGGVVGVLMAWQGYGVWSLVGQQLSGSVVGVAVLWTATAWRPKLLVSWSHVRQMFAFGSNVMGIQLVGFLHQRSDVLLLGYFLGEEAVGYYAVAWSLVRQGTEALSRTVSAVSLPTFSRLQQHLDQMRSAFLTATRMTAAIAVPAFCGAIVLAPDFIPLIMGEKWTRSVPLFQILAVIGAWYSVAFFNGPLIMACGRPGQLLFIRCVAFGLRTAGLLVAVWWGLKAVAFAFLIATLLHAPLPIWSIRRLANLDVRRYVKGLSGPFWGAVIMGAGVFVLREMLIPSMGRAAVLAICVPSGVALYCGFLLLAERSILHQFREFVGLMPLGRLRKRQ